MAHLEPMGSHILSTQTLGSITRNVCLLCCFLRRPEVEMRIHSTGYLLTSPLEGHKRIFKCPSLPSTLGQWKFVWTCVCWKKKQHKKKIKHSWNHKGSRDLNEALKVCGWKHFQKPTVLVFMGVWGLTVMILFAGLEETEDAFFCFMGSQSVDVQVK